MPSPHVNDSRTHRTMTNRCFIGSKISSYHTLVIINILCHSQNLSRLVLMDDLEKQKQIILQPTPVASLRREQFSK